MYCSTDNDDVRLLTCISLALLLILSTSAGLLPLKIVPFSDGPGPQRGC